MVTQQTTATNEKRPAWNAGGVTIICEACKKPFPVKPSHANKRRSCSRECGKVVRRKIMSGSGNHQYGLKRELNASWKGGKRISNYGYVLVADPDHSRQSDSYALEHRLIMEKHIGRRLKRDEVVHHVNGNKTDNRLENLELMSLSEHSALHGEEKIGDYERDSLGRFMGLKKSEVAQ